MADIRNNIVDPTDDYANFKDHLRRSWSVASSTLWSAENPARGQCGVTSLVANEFLGGEILKTRIGDDWHFYNVIKGCRLDFTASQFDRPIEYQDVPSNRAEAFSDTNAEQYRALSERTRSLQARG
jgi:hypothetical protein